MRLSQVPGAAPTGSPLNAPQDTDTAEQQVASLSEPSVDITEEWTKLTREQITDPLILHEIPPMVRGISFVDGQELSEEAIDKIFRRN
jgi:hypothetical protein